MYRTLEAPSAANLDSAMTPQALEALGDISTRLAGSRSRHLRSRSSARTSFAASAPANGASTAEVLTHYADHRTITPVLIATYVLSAAASSCSWAGRCVDLSVALGRDGRSPASSAPQASCTVHDRRCRTGAVSGRHTRSTRHRRWSKHCGHCTTVCSRCSTSSIAAALVGLSRAGVAAGITPEGVPSSGPVGAAMLVVGTLAGPSIAIGDAAVVRRGRHRIPHLAELPAHHRHPHDPFE